MTLLQLSNFTETTNTQVRYVFRICFIINNEYRTTNKPINHTRYFKESHKVIKDLDVSN